MDQDKTRTTPLTDNTEQSNTQCPNKDKQDFDSEKVIEESGGSNESVVHDNFICDKHITNRTPSEIREKLGFDIEDVHAGFEKWITRCVGIRSTFIGEYNETYELSDITSREKTVMGRLCPNKGTQDLDSEKVTEESDDSNESSVDDNCDSDKHITKRTPSELREKLGVDSEDVHDGFKKWKTRCAGIMSTLKYKDKESRGQTFFRSLRRLFNDRRSRGSKHKAKKYIRSQSHEDVKRKSHPERKHSYNEALNKDNEMTPSNKSVNNTWSERQRVPPHTHVNYDFRSPQGVEVSIESKVSNPSQTNIQSHPMTSNATRDQPMTDPDVYSFTNSERGYLVNIVNDRFIRQARRDGANLDLLNMQEIGRKFGFRLLNYNNDRNLTKEQTMSLLTQIQKADHSKCDCFMFMISTHGLEQRNPALRGEIDHALVCADDRLIFTSTILNMFNDSNCPTLKGKPKVFFIQACRGEELDRGSDVYVVSPKKVDMTDTTIVPDTNTRLGRLDENESLDEFDTHPGQDSWALHHGMMQCPLLETRNISCQNRNQDFRYQFEFQPSEFGSQPLFFAPKRAPFPTANTLSNNYTVTNVPFSPTGGAHIPRPYPIVDTPSLQCSNDMLVMYAIPQGFFAWRSNSDGSWMIDYLHQVLMSYDMNTPKNFLSLLTKVSAKMSLRETYTPSSFELHKKKAIPVIEHKLDKDIIFRPKVPGAALVTEVQLIYSREASLFS